MIKGRSSDPRVTRPPRAHACVLFYGPRYGRGLDGGKRKETVTWYWHPRDTKTVQYWSWPPSHRTQPVIKLTERASLFVANGLHVPPIAYKLRGDLPGLILQVAGTPTHRVLVWVSAIVYTRILVSDRIGACPYRPFSKLKHKSHTDWVYHIPVTKQLAQDVIWMNNYCSQ